MHSFGCVMPYPLIQRGYFMQSCGYIYASQTLQFGIHYLLIQCNNKRTLLKYGILLLFFSWSLNWFFFLIASIWKHSGFQGRSFFFVTILCFAFLCGLAVSVPPSPVLSQSGFLPLSIPSSALIGYRFFNCSQSAVTAIGVLTLVLGSRVFRQSKSYWQLIVGPRLVGCSCKQL